MNNPDLLHSFISEEVLISPEVDALIIQLFAEHDVEFDGMSLPESLVQQLQKAIKVQMIAVLNRAPIEQRQTIIENFNWVQDCLVLYAESRMQRAKEIESPEVEEARKLAKAYIGDDNHDFFCTCVDDRCISLLMYSKVPRVGGVLRSPAAALEGIFRGRGRGEVFVDWSSPVVKQIKKLLKDRPGETIYYGLDSHFGCAARGLLHNEAGSLQCDHGLASDVEAKLVIAQGLLEIRKKMIAEGEEVAQIIPTLFSFNPLNGYVAMGMEVNLGDEEVIQKGFTFKDPHSHQEAHEGDEEYVVDKLVRAGRLVSTEELMAEPEIKWLLENVFSGKDIDKNDFRVRYPQKLLENWQVITQLYDEGEGRAFNICLEKLTAVYTNAKWTIGDEDDLFSHKIAWTTLYQKAKFLLKNLVTRYSIARDEEEWPYDTHKAINVVITNGGYGPFPQGRSAVPQDAFSVFSMGADMAEAVELTTRLVRDFRKNGSSGDPVGNGYEEPLVARPVNVINKIIIKPENSEQVFRLLENLDTSILSQLDWLALRHREWTKEMTSALIRKMVDRSSNLPQISWEDRDKIEDAFHDLILRLQKLVGRGALYNNIIEGRVVITNLIVDDNRCPKVFIPVAI